MISDMLVKNVKKLGYLSVVVSEYTNLMFN